MTVGLISSYSVSCVVRLQKSSLLRLRFFLSLNPFFLALMFYCFVMSSMRTEDNLVSYFLFCLMLACICSFIFECVVVAIVAYCFTLNVVVPDVSKKDVFMLDLKLFERLHAVIYAISFFVNTLVGINVST